MSQQLIAAFWILLCIIIRMNVLAHGNGPVCRKWCDSRDSQIHPPLHCTPPSHSNAQCSRFNDGCCQNSKTQYANPATEFFPSDNAFPHECSLLARLLHVTLITSCSSVQCESLLQVRYFKGETSLGETTIITGDSSLQGI